MEIDEKTGRVTINGVIYGHVSHGRNVSKKTEGWYFIPATSAHKSGRVLKATREAAIPPYVKRAARLAKDAMNGVVKLDLSGEPGKNTRTINNFVNMVIKTVNAAN